MRAPAPLEAQLAAALRHVQLQAETIRKVRRTLDTAERLLAGHMADAKRHGATDRQLAEAADLSVTRVRRLLGGSTEATPD